MGLSNDARMERGDRNPVRKVLIPVITAILLSATALVRTEGFSTNKIRGRLALGEAPVPSSEISAKLSQRYRYLAKGRQCFVFASEDGKEVLKFLNYNRFSFPRWIFSLPMPSSCRFFLEEYADRRQSRYQKTIESLTLGYEKLSRETGIEYLHLQPGGVLPIAILVGPAGSLRRIDLNQVAFILQKRADAPIFEKLASIAKEKGEEGLRKALTNILALLERRCALAIADDDRDIEINFGFLEETPLLIDPGRLFLNCDLKTEQGVRFEMRESTKKLYKWLSGNYPSTAEWLKMEITSESGVSKNQ